MHDDIKSSRSVSNLGSKNTVTGGGSAVSTASSVWLKAEASLAALMTRRKILDDEHEWEECLKGKKEHLKRDEEIAEHMAKLNAKILEHPKWKLFHIKAFRWN